MSDLISRSEAIELLYKTFDEYRIATDKTSTLVGFGSEVFKRVREIPTVYDIDKVVKELEEMIHPKQLYFCIYARGGCKHLDNDDKDCMECVVENAIEIVKQGGVRNDVCEWKSASDGEFIQNPHTKRLYSNEPSMQNVYCNTCGKKIKVVE